MEWTIAMTNNMIPDIGVHVTVRLWTQWFYEINVFFNKFGQSFHDIAKTNSDFMKSMSFLVRLVAVFTTSLFKANGDFMDTAFVLAKIDCFISHLENGASFHS